MADEEFEARLHRTWLALLINGNYKEVAALVVDARLTLLQGTYEIRSISVDLPPSAHVHISRDESLKSVIERTLRHLCTGHLLDQNGNRFEEFDIEYRIKLLEPEPNWRDVVKELIINAEHPNQGTITEKVFSREGKPILTYNEMKFGSRSEIRIAQELERRKVLFFPLPLAVRADTGTMYKDHREVDFLICLDGAWGILEVAHHVDRYEKDSEKDAWFKTSGILHVQHYTAERCYNESSQVVDEFLNILAKYKRH